jgi:nucleotide-binding universal stress UspA family protein
MPSTDALRTAVRLAASFELAEVTVLHVYFNAGILADETIESRQRDRLATYLDRMRLRLGVRPVCIENPFIARTILRVAGEQACELIVMATRGRSRAADILLPSVTAEVFAGSQVQALAVKHFGAYLGLWAALIDHKLRHREEPRFG